MLGSAACYSLTLMAEIYISTDVETDGPAPGLNSMLSFGSAAYLADKTLIGTFSANLEALPGATSDPDNDAMVGDATRRLGSVSQEPAAARHSHAGVRRVAEGIAG